MSGFHSIFLSMIGPYSIVYKFTLKLQATKIGLVLQGVSIPLEFLPECACIRPLHKPSIFVETPNSLSRTLHHLWLARFLILATHISYMIIWMNLTRSSPALNSSNICVDKTLPTPYPYSWLVRSGKNVNVFRDHHHPSLGWKKHKCKRIVKLNGG